MRAMITYTAMAIVLGHHVRVGNEDNLWGANRKRMTSVDQIKGAVRISQQFGRKVATAEEARKIMKVGVWYHRVEETLQNLGLPPREGDNKGFLVWTDRKKTLPVVASDSHHIVYCMVPPEPILGAQQGSRASEGTRDVGIDREVVGGKKS
jgi:hypothetical protein